MLADRVGIIDHGRIVAEGTPAALKAEIGRPTVEAVPPTPERARRGSRAVLERFGEPCRGSPEASPCGSREGDDLADVVRALDARGLEVAHLQLHAPTLDDVFLAKTGRSLEGAAASRSPSRCRRRERAEPAVADPGRRRSRCRSVVRTLRQPACAIPPLIFPLMLMAVNAGGLEAATELPGLPDRLVPRVRARRAVHPGRAVRDDERRHRPRPRHPDRLPQPALADARARRARCSPGQLGGDRRARRRPGGLLPRGRPRDRRRTSPPGAARRRSCCSLLAALDLARLRRARRYARAPDRLRRGGPGPRSRCSSSSCSSRR